MLQAGLSSPLGPHLIWPPLQPLDRGGAVVTCMDFDFVEDDRPQREHFDVVGHRTSGEMDLHPLADLAAVICDKRGLDSLGVADDASLIQATAKVGADKIIVADLTDEEPQLVQRQRLLPFEHQAATSPSQRKGRAWRDPEPGPCVERGNLSSR